MGKSIAAERTWPIRLLALAAALAMVAVGLVTASTAAIADDETESRIGNDAEDRAIVDLRGEFLVVDTNNPAEVEGWIREVEFHAGDTGTVSFLIVDDDDVVTAVSEPYKVTSLGNDEAPFNAYVDEGDNLGVYTHEDHGIVSFDYSGTNAFWSGGGINLPEVDDSVSSEQGGARTYSMNATIELPGFGPDEAVVCDSEGCDDISASSGDQGLSASTDVGSKGDSALLGLRFRNDEDDHTATEFSAACNGLMTERGISPNAWLGEGVAHLDEAGLGAGSITLTSTIAGSAVDDLGETNGVGLFQICLGAEDADYAGYSGLDPIAGTDLHGPILLEPCNEGDEAKDACVEGRQRTEDGGIELTYRIPAQDPMLR